MKKLIGILILSSVTVIQASLPLVTQTEKVSPSSATPIFAIEKEVAHLEYGVKVFKQLLVSSKVAFSDNASQKRFEEHIEILHMARKTVLADEVGLIQLNAGHTMISYSMNMILDLERKKQLAITPNAVKAYQKAKDLILSAVFSLGDMLEGVEGARGMAARPFRQEVQKIRFQELYQ